MLSKKNCGKGKILSKNYPITVCRDFDQLYYMDENVNRQVFCKLLYQSTNDDVK